MIQDLAHAFSLYMAVRNGATVGVLNGAEEVISETTASAALMGANAPIACHHMMRDKNQMAKIATFLIDWGLRTAEGIDITVELVPKLAKMRCVMANGSIQIMLPEEGTQLVDDEPLHVQMEGNVWVAVRVAGGLRGQGATPNDAIRALQIQEKNGCRPSSSKSGRQPNMICDCGAELPVDNPTSICKGCLNREDDY